MRKDSAVRPLIGTAWNPSASAARPPRCPTDRGQRRPNSAQHRPTLRRSRPITPNPLALTMRGIGHRLEQKLAPKSTESVCRIRSFVGATSADIGFGPRPHARLLIRICAASAGGTNIGHCGVNARVVAGRMSAAGRRPRVNVLKCKCASGMGRNFLGECKPLRRDLTKPLAEPPGGAFPPENGLAATGHRDGGRRRHRCRHRRRHRRQLSPCVAVRRRHQRGRCRCRSSVVVVVVSPMRLPVSLPPPSLLSRCGRGRPGVSSGPFLMVFGRAARGGEARSTVGGNRIHTEVSRMLLAMMPATCGEGESWLDWHLSTTPWAQHWIDMQEGV